MVQPQMAQQISNEIQVSLSTGLYISDTLYLFQFLNNSMASVQILHLSILCV